ncbi:hypothetical protein [Hydrogenovibrio marinus]|uniref:Uncharacterized protein n=1 Tax=Hydrogenovibrio marinus TaxID=28885 RepID=A0A066ZWY5_HYDMR|nr:hypothetical protein [Hydrogenovibrio marinus]KDN94610.1 hypothetical protein EI16_11950 [Hydrogenovibrio marinus]
MSNVKCVPDLLFLSGLVLIILVPIHVVSGVWILHGSLLILMGVGIAFAKDFCLFSLFKTSEEQEKNNPIDKVFYNEKRK